MSVVRVAIPLLKGKRRFFLEKGRPWSLVEHVMLAALAIKPRTVDELAISGDLPRRLVLEALIRLMRAGWVVLQQESKGVVFSATPAGKEVVGDEELPQISKVTNRWMNFVIDKITGTIYRSRELPFLEKHLVTQRAEREPLVWLEPREVEAFDDTTGVLAALFDDDEKFVSVEPSSERMVERFAIASVRNDAVEGLPARAPDELFELVRNAARSAPIKPAGSQSPRIPSGQGVSISNRAAEIPFDAIFRSGDLVLGGQAHKEALHQALDRARHRIIIHSTFITQSGFETIRSLLNGAVARGAIIDVLWGQDDDKADTVTSAMIVTKLRDEIDREGMSSALRVHRFSTRSHAKLLVCDDGRADRMFAIVGSCNWLSSNFQNYEASVRFADPQVVATILEQLADLSRGHDRHWTELTSEMARLAAEARRQRPPSGSKAKVAIVLGPQHAQFGRLARDEAVSRIFVTSHKLGAAIRTAVIVPAITAVEEKNIDVKVYYGVGAADASTNAALTQSGARDGLNVQLIEEPRLHAKILAWDDDSVLITSQNWLSADPGDSKLRKEIGVYVRAQGVARDVIDNFEASRVAKVQANS
ncbi:phospholipase D-like domain-containing protein [Paraburkholderia sp. ZP32-5]|uniref:phospholipase D-like domain-containing protein n=1 Tax=Paraburkholderia sp. ZP32-5 TaxID=2883245 RepID=UPI001F22E5A5|nr:phospholipase D-like domain-containing protein [Paraburkholderia sp. ZP32-5]